MLISKFSDFNSNEDTDLTYINLCKFYIDFKFEFTKLLKYSI